MSLAGVSKILEGASESERRRFCERTLAQLEAERRGMGVFAALVAVASAFASVVALLFFG